jgi:hypothetical protein
MDLDDKQLNLYVVTAPEKGKVHWGWAVGAGALGVGIGVGATFLGQHLLGEDTGKKK